MTQIGKNFGVIKPRMWMQITYFHLHGNCSQKYVFNWIIHPAPQKKNS